MLDIILRRRWYNIQRKNHHWTGKVYLARNSYRRKFWAIILKKVGPSHKSQWQAQVRHTRRSYWGEMWTIWRNMRHNRRKIRQGKTKRYLVQRTESGHWNQANASFAERLIPVTQIRKTRCFRKAIIKTRRSRTTEPAKKRYWKGKHKSSYRWAQYAAVLFSTNDIPK